jgi:hypothetical protein
MKHLFTVFLLMLFIVCYGQTDSLEIKLQQYKKLYDKGLITQAEYEVLKARELKLGDPPQNTEQAPAAEPAPEKLKARSERVNIRVCPVFFHDVARSYFDKYRYGYGTSSTLFYNLGLNIQVGANIKRKYFPNLSIALEGSPKRTCVLLGGDFNMNITKGKMPPYFHIGIGYIYQRYVTGRSTANEYSGLYTDFGFGFAAYVSKNIFITMAPQYRFIFYNQPAYRLDPSIPNEQLAKLYYIHNYIHQLGIKFQVVFL